MFGTRRFMDDVPMLGRPVFQSLDQEVALGQAAAAATPAPPPVVEKPNTAARVGTVLATLGVGFLALELTGITHLTGLKKALS